MNIEALKQQLAAGTITAEQFAAELAKLLAAGTITQEQHDEAAAASNDGGNQGGGNQGFTDEQLAAIQKMMQSEGDKVRTKAANEKKLLEDQLEAIKIAKMTEEQKTKHELDKLRKQNEDTATELLREKVAFHTVKTLTSKQLPTEFGDFLVGGSIEDTDANIVAFETAWQKALKTKVDEKFAAGGSDPMRGKGGAAGGNNPFSKEHFNLTKQAELFKSDPELAKQLQATAKI